MCEVRVLTVAANPEFMDKWKIITKTSALFLPLSCSVHPAVQTTLQSNCWGPCLRLWPTCNAHLRYGLYTCIHSQGSETRKPVAQEQYKCKHSRTLVHFCISLVQCGLTRLHVQPETFNGNQKHVHSQNPNHVHCHSMPIILLSTLTLTTGVVLGGMSLKSEVSKEGFGAWG